MANKISSAPPPITPIRGISYTPKPKPTIPPADYETWCKADLWSIERGILLLLGTENIPYGKCEERGFYKAYQDDFDKMLEIAKSSIEVGKLKQTGNGLLVHKLSQVLPSDFIAWARVKGYSIPVELKVFESGVQPEAVGVDEKTKMSANDQRNKIAQEWLVTKNPGEIEAMTKKEILNALKLFSPGNNRLFDSGGLDWLGRDHSVIPKRKSGRRPSK